jgi:hypothetical protein
MGLLDDLKKLQKEIGFCSCGASYIWGKVNGEKRFKCIRCGNDVTDKMEEYINQSNKLYELYGGLKGGTETSHLRVPQTLREGGKRNAMYGVWNSLF